MSRSSPTRPAAAKQPPPATSIAAHEDESFDGSEQPEGRTVPNVEMRILMLTPDPAVRGPVSKITHLLAQALRQHQCRVEIERWGRHSDSEGVFRKIGGRLGDIRRIRRRLSHEAFDVMLVATAHGWITLFRDIPLLACTRRFDGARIVQFHGSRSDALMERGHLVFKAATRTLLRLSDGVLVLSKVEQEEFQQFYPSASVYAVSNPFRPTRASSRQRVMGIPTLLYVGRLIPEKGILDLLEALAHLQNRIFCHLNVVGAGPVLQQAVQRAADLGIAENATFVGHLEKQQLAELYESSDVFVLPTYWFEGFPTVIAEAMGAGLPVVTTCIRGIADHLEDGINALFVPPRSPLALADTIERLLRDGALRGRMAAANLRKVEQFAPELVARDYLEALYAIVDASSGRSGTR